MIRDSIKSAQVSAMKAGDKTRLAAVRLILAKLKDKDIELRTSANVPDDDVLVVDVLQKMAKQRRESITMYEQGGRQELAEVEKTELAVIEVTPGGLVLREIAEGTTEAAVRAATAAPLVTDGPLGHF